MAERPDERVEMRDVDPDQDDDYDNDPPRPGYQETNLDETGDVTIDEGLSMDDTISTADIDNMSQDDMEKMRQSGLKNVFLEITGEPIEPSDNESLFSKTKVTVGKKGFKTLWYDGEKIFYKSKGIFSKWTVYTKFALRNPMEAEFEKAKENYKVTSRSQINEAAGVNVAEDASEDVRQNVIDDLRYQGDPEVLISDEPTTTSVASVAFYDTEENVPTSSVSKQTSYVDVEKLQARLRTLEKVIDDQEKNFYKKHRVLNELRAKGANEDVVSSKEQEINKLQEKLRKVKLEKDQLLLDVNVSNELLSEASEKLRDLTQMKNENTERFEQFKEAATKEFKAQKSEIVNRYWQQQKYDKEQARQEYTEALSQAKLEFSEQIKKAEADRTKLERELVKEKEKLKYLQQAEHKQHEKRQDMDGTDRVVPGVQQSIDRIYSIIERSDPKYDELSDDDLERDLDANINTLKKQAENFKQRAKNSKGITKQTYENIQKNIEREIDIINLRLDRKVEYQEAKLKLKEEVENNPGVRWERIKKWIKDNKWGVLSVTFGVGSFIASIIMAVRNAVKSAAKGVSSFGQSVVKVLKKLGPVFAAIGSILLTALGIISQGLMFLANNLWILLVLLAMILWKYFGKYFKRK